jgi:hypothetical protein
VCLSDVIHALRKHDLRVTVSQVRWAITSNKVSRPQLDGSLRFDFQQQHVDELLAYFSARHWQKSS